LSQIFGDNLQRYNAYIRAASGIGMTAGQGMGSLIYTYYGFQWVFMSISIVFFFCLLVNIILLEEPEKVKSPEAERMEQWQDENG